MAGRKKTPPRRPEIYGDKKKARQALARYIGQGQDLLGKAVGVRKRVARAKAKQVERLRVAPSSPPPKPGPFGMVLTSRLLTPDEVGDRVARDWLNDLDRWRDRTRRAMQDHLQDHFSELLPTLDRPIPPQEGEHRSHISLDIGEPWLHAVVNELQQVQAALGVQRKIEAAPAPTAFAELHGSGLVEAKVITDHAKRMAASMRTAKQRGDAIGAAKELIEATLRGALTRLNVTYDRRDDLPKLMAKWRGAVGQLAPPDPAGQSSLDGAQRSLASLVTFLAEWRNRYGTGHGRPEYPPGLKPRHARIATDTADTCIRFIVTTMDDLALLSPS